MSLSKKMETAFNKQINAEWFAAYLYKSMAAYFEAQGLKGFAHWMNLQVLEEFMHGDKIFNFVCERFGIVVLMSIDKPKSVWKNSLAVFQDAFKHEQKVTLLINKLVDVATIEKDYASTNFLQWFVNEQVEEESSVDGIVQKLKMISNDKVALLNLDKELGQRPMPTLSVSS